MIYKGTLESAVLCELTVSRLGQVYFFYFSILVEKKTKRGRLLCYLYWPIKEALALGNKK